MSIQLPDKKVFEWLGNDSKGVPYYLCPLNLTWSNEGVDHDLKIFRRVAEQLAAEPEYWAEIIRTVSWRHTLAGCACLLASSRHEFFDDLCFRFREGSWVTPQIAVTIGLLHGAAARSFFESVLGDSVMRNRRRQSVSALRILQRLGANPKDDIALDSGNAADQEEAMVTDEVVAEHWEFWSKRV